MPRLRLLPFLLLPALLAAQARLGELLYADPVGRGIRLVVVDAGSPDRMTLRPETGTMDHLRKLVLAFAGPERFRAAEVQDLAGSPPAGWRVDHRSGGELIRVGDMTFWRYLPGQVLPVKFVFDRKVWTLQSAELPSRAFRP